MLMYYAFAKLYRTSFNLWNICYKELELTIYKFKWKMFQKIRRAKSFLLLGLHKVEPSSRPNYAGKLCRSDHPRTEGAQAYCIIVHSFM